MLVNEIVNGEINFLHSTGKTYSVGSSNTNANIDIITEPNDNIIFN